MTWVLYGFHYTWHQQRRPFPVHITRWKFCHQDCIRPLHILQPTSSSLYDKIGTAWHRLVLTSKIRSNPVPDIHPGYPTSQGLLTGYKNRFTSRRRTLQHHGQIPHCLHELILHTAGRDILHGFSVRDFSVPPGFLLDLVIRRGQHHGLVETCYPPRRPPGLPPPADPELQFG
jgi:hypothetical protein